MIIVPVLRERISKAVTFQVKWRKDEESVLEDIPAHKLLLASVSDVFASMFFGDMKEGGEVVELKETTIVAAKTLFSYIYKRPGTVQIDNMSMRNTFHLYKLADR